MFINPVQVEDKTLWDGYCRCHSYRISAKEVGRVSESVNKPLEYCKRLTGFRPEEWTDVFVSWFQELQIWTRQNMSFIQEKLDD